MAKTTKGFEYEVQDIEDDFELLELFREVDKNPLLLIDIAKRVLGDEGYSQLKEFCRVDGKVSIALIHDELDEILNGSPDTKK